MPHGLTIDELLENALKCVVDRCQTVNEAASGERPALVQSWQRALAYSAGIKAAAECIENRAFDIPLTCPPKPWRRRIPVPAGSLQEAVIKELARRAKLNGPADYVDQGWASIAIHALTGHDFRSNTDQHPQNPADREQALSEAPIG